MAIATLNPTTGQLIQIILGDPELAAIIGTRAVH